MSWGSSAWISLASTLARSLKFVPLTVSQICEPAWVRPNSEVAWMAGVRSAPRYRLRVMTLICLGLSAAWAAGAIAATAISVRSASRTRARERRTGMGTLLRGRLHGRADAATLSGRFMVRQPPAAACVDRGRLRASTAGDGREDLDLAAVLDRGLQPVAEADVLAVDVD